MTKLYFEKELTLKNEKKANEYKQKVEAIRSEVNELKAKKKEAETKVPELERQINKLVTDVEIITNESTRKSALKKKRQLQDELDEWELFAGMNIEAYESKRYEELTQLGALAMKEKLEYEKRVRELKKEIEAVHKEQLNELQSALNGKHPFNHVETEYAKGMSRAQAEERNKQRIEDMKERNKQEVYRNGTLVGYQIPEYNDEGEVIGHTFNMFK